MPDNIIKALKDNNSFLVQQLINSGIKLELFSEDMLTAFIQVINDKNINLCNTLITSINNINFLDEKGFSLLHRAVLLGNSDAVRLLLRNHIDLELKTKIGLTALSLAINNNDKKIYLLLIKAGADINFVDDTGVPMLHSAIIANNNDLIKILVEHGFSLESKEKLGYTAIHRAILQKNNYAIKLLIENGVNLETITESGATALFLAIRESNNYAVEMLIDNGANIEYKRDGIPPLSEAIAEKNNEAVKILLKNGANIESNDKLGFTPLLQSISSNNEQALKMLLEKGANLNVEVKGFTPYKMVKKLELQNIVAILDKYKLMTDKITSTNKLEEAYSKLDNIIGLNTVKVNIRSIINSIKIEKLRARGKSISAGHYIFQGNPGTGKTTVARLMGDILKELSVLSKGHFKEVTREDLVAGYVGQTAIKTRTILEESLGGILFIDEAYSLSTGGDNDFGQEAIDTIVPFMENNRNDFVIIIAGYNKEMNDFLSSNTGLKSRFNHTLDFRDYSNDEMIDIFKIFITNEEFKLDVGIEKELVHIFQKIKENSKHFGNGREARKVFEEVCNNLDDRLVSINDLVEGDERLFLITLEDLPKVI